MLASGYKFKIYIWTKITFISFSVVKNVTYWIDYQIGVGYASSANITAKDAPYKHIPFFSKNWVSNCRPVFSLSGLCNLSFRFWWPDLYFFVELEDISALTVYHLISLSSDSLGLGYVGQDRTIQWSGGAPCWHPLLAPWSSSHLLPGTSWN